MTLSGYTNLQQLLQRWVGEQRTILANTTNTLTINNDEFHQRRGDQRGVGTLNISIWFDDDDAVCQRRQSVGGGRGDGDDQPERDAGVEQRGNINLQSGIVNLTGRWRRR